MTAEPEYVIAGGGSAGCVLAARLAQAGRRVTLVEAGGPARSIFVAMPAGNGWLFGNPAYDWRFESVPQPGLGGRRIGYPRGLGLGGSSNLNGMIHIRGARSDFDGWRARGLEGWGYAEFLPYFLRAQGSDGPPSPYRGHDGPLRTTHVGRIGPLDRRFVEAARQAGAPDNAEFNGAGQLGVGAFEIAVGSGRRMSAARAYLARRPPSLTVRARTRALGVVIERGRAVGLRVAGPSGVETLRASREVILAAGAFGSPQLLMLSGVGPAAHLRAHGLPVVVDLPGVGEALADHANMPVQFACPDPRLSHARLQRLDRALGVGLSWLLAKRGPAAAPFWSVCLFESLAAPPVEPPDLQTFFTPMVVKEARDLGDVDEATLLERLGRRVFVRGSKAAVAGFQFDVNQLRPASRGTVRLASADPADAPLIDPRMLSEPRDLAELVAGVRRAREIVAQPAFEGARGRELSPGVALRTDAEIAQAVRALVTTGHHPVSTCRMGPDGDAMAVLDARLRVRGVEGLRVCDASAFPDQLAGNPNAAITALAEKAADLILDRAPPPPVSV